VETDEIYYVPYQRMQEFIKTSLEDNLRIEENYQMKREIEKQREKCTKYINPKGKIQFDTALDYLISWNRIVI
jgi:hypothetical protein